MSTTWIHCAIGSGGTLAVSAPIPGNRILLAKMDWPGEQTVTGRPSLSIDTALASLEEMLLEDAADEMRQSGAA